MKAFFSNISLLLVSLLVSLLLLEQGFRCWLFGRHAFDIEALRNNVPIVNAGFMQQSPFDDIYWALQPNLDTTFKLARLTTNSRGLADGEYPLQKAPGTYRIAVLGDSYSMASGVDTDKSFHAILEQQMNQYGQRRYEIINFAVGGFGLERYNATLDHLVPEWQPDAILLGYCAFNDHQPLPPPTGSVPPFNPPRVDGFWMSYIIEYLDMQWSTRKITTDSATMVLDEKRLAFVERELQEMRALADGIKPGMPILLAYLDNRQHSAEDLRAIDAIAQRHGMSFVDTSNQFSGTHIDDYSIHLLDSHPNNTAHTMFAETLFNAIRRQQLFGFTAEAKP